jgi:hypothetical protein
MTEIIVRFKDQEVNKMYHSTTSTTGEPLCDKCTHWTGYYCMIDKYSYKKISCYNYRRRS